MKSQISFSSLVITLLWTAIFPASAQVNVIQQHNNLSRDGVYIDSAFTPANAANLTRDLNFNGTIAGNVYAQPLYVEGGPNGAMIIAVTESNNVYALHANDGSIIWQRNLGPAVTSGLPCGNISPLGISGTPVVEVASRSLFLDAMIDGAPISPEDVDFDPQDPDSLVIERRLAKRRGNWWQLPKDLKVDEE